LGGLTEEGHAHPFGRITLTPLLIVDSDAEREDGTPTGQVAQLRVTAEAAGEAARDAVQGDRLRCLWARWRQVSEQVRASARRSTSDVSQITQRRLSRGSASRDTACWR